MIAVIYFFFFRNISRMWWRMRIRNKQIHWRFMNMLKYSCENGLILDVVAALVRLWRNHSRVLWMSMKFREVNCFESSSVINFRYVIQSLSRSWLNYVTDFVYNKINRGYYTVARRYEFYVRVARTISHEWAKRTSEILLLPREHKIHIFELTCNVLFII